MSRASLIKLCDKLKCSNQGTNKVLSTRINNMTKEPCAKYYLYGNKTVLTEYGKKYLNGEVNGKSELG